MTIALYTVDIDRRPFLAPLTALTCELCCHYHSTTTAGWNMRKFAPRIPSLIAINYRATSTAVRGTYVGVTSWPLLTGIQLSWTSIPHSIGFCGQSLRWAGSVGGQVTNIMKLLPWAFGKVLAYTTIHNF